jgi:hypothetical protein
MKLATLEEYRKLVYAEGSAPSISTLRRRIGEIQGGMKDLGRYWVDLHKNEKAGQIQSELQDYRSKAKKNPNLAGLI